LTSSRIPAGLISVPDRTQKTQVDCGIKFRDTVFLCFCVINFQFEPLFNPVYRLYNVLSTVVFTVSEHAKGASGFSVRD